MKFEIVTIYDGWRIYVWDKEKIKEVVDWNHNDADKGIGGEKLFAQILTELGYEVETKDEY